MIKNSTKAAAMLAVIFFIYGACKSYVLQREDYESNISSRLELACRKCIIDDFGSHVSLINLYSHRNNWDFKRKSEFSISNNLYSLQIEVSSILYFQDLAPQEITCSAVLQHGVHEKISTNTVINFHVIGPLYLPENYNTTWANRQCQLTIKQIEQITPMSALFNLEKPTYSIFNFYLRKFVL